MAVAMDERGVEQAGSEHSVRLRPRILVVEDEGIIARDIQRILTRLEYEVTGHATSGPEALEMAALVKADLVLMDIKIRGEMDGVATAEEIRRRYRIPVIFLTAHADSDTLGRATRTGPFGYILKPFTEADIKVTVEVALQRNRLQRDAEEKEQWFHTALQSVSDALVATNYDGRIEFLNSRAERLTGWSMKEARGRYFREVVKLQPQEGGSLGEDWGIGIAPDEPVVFAGTTLIRRDGDSEPVAGSAAPIRRAGSSEATGMVMILRESAAVAAEPIQSGSSVDVEGSSQELRELSYALTHDLREPVRNMSCFAELLGLSMKEQNGGALEGPVKDYLQFIVNGSRRMDALLVSLHRYNAAQEAERVPNAVADAALCLGAALRKLERLIHENRAEVDVGGPLPMVASDPTSLTDIFEILVDNAIRFRSERDPVMHIHAERAGDFWRFAVTDNGLGLDTAQRERIFHLFKKAHDQTRTGSGLGLAICRRRVELYGGRIWVESEPGAGATFYFTVPATVD